VVCVCQREGVSWMGNVSIHVCRMHIRVLVINSSLGHKPQVIIHCTSGWKSQKSESKTLKALYLESVPFPFIFRLTCSLPLTLLHFFQLKKHRTVMFMFIYISLSVNWKNSIIYFLSLWTFLLQIPKVLWWIVGS